MSLAKAPQSQKQRSQRRKNIKKDTAPPIISSHQITENANGTLTVKARIHDHKSSNMPQDWNAIAVHLDEASETIPMIWYGENLWVVTFTKPQEVKSLKICAEDYCGNKTCLTLN